MQQYTGVTEGGILTFYYRTTHMQHMSEPGDSPPLCVGTSGHKVAENLKNMCKIGRSVGCQITKTLPAPRHSNSPCCFRMLAAPSLDGHRQIYIYYTQHCTSVRTRSFARSEPNIATCFYVPRTPPPATFDPRKKGSR